MDIFRELFDRTSCTVKLRNAALRDRGGGVMYEVARFTIKAGAIYRRHEQRRPHDSGGLPTGPSRECDLELFRVEDMPIDLASRRVIVFCRCLEGPMEGQGFTCSQAFFANNFRPTEPDTSPMPTPQQSDQHVSAALYRKVVGKLAGYVGSGSEA
jgi:hypothetical protein